MNAHISDNSRFLYPVLVVVITTCAQVIAKWQLNISGAAPSDFSEKLLYLMRLFINPWILCCLVLGFVSMLIYLLALGKFELSHVFTFITCMTIVSVMSVGVILGYETLTPTKALAVLIIVIGIVIMNLK